MVAHGVSRCGAKINQTRTTRVTLRQWHKPRAYQSMANTLQVDGLARITGLTQAPITDASSTTELTTPYALLFCCRGKFAINHKRFGG